MTFPTGQISTTHLDSSTDDPSLARADLLDAVQKLNTIIDEGGGANGVAILDSSGHIPSTQLPQSITYTGAGAQVINPTSGIVNIQNILRLTPYFKSDLLDITTATLQVGDLALSKDVNSGTVGICLYDGTQWVKMSTDGAVT